MTTTPATGPNILDPALIADPRGGFNLVREEVPVVLGQSADGTAAWYVTRHDDVRAVLGDPRFVTSPVSVAGTDAVDNRDQMFEMLGIAREFVPSMTSSILDVDGIDHVRLRKLVSRAFTVRRVNALRPRVEEITSALLAGLHGSVDLISEFAYPLPITVICELVGIPEADRPLWREAGAASNSIAPGAMGTAVRQMVTYTHDLIDKRRTQPADDLLTDLIRAQDEDGDRLSDVEMVTMVLALVTAGHETTANLIGNGALALLTHPDQLETLRREPGLWPTAVNELMRWCGPVQIAQLRYATADVEVGGQAIAAGEAVQAVLVSANHDPREYDEPERLDVTRRPAGRGDGHVGFGHGIHYCLGAALAKQEGEVALRSLFDRFPAMALEATEQTWVAVPGMRQLASLPVTIR